MTPERWIHIRTLFDQALDLPPGQRDAFLDQACADDAQLRAKVEALLEADAQPPPILEASPDDLAALLPETTPPDLEGQQIGPYRLVQEIGHGGMGTVYLAERADDQFQKRVAIKLVKRGMDTDEILRRFRYERQILAGLEHPHIARLYDGGRADDGRPYLVMEYVGGQRIDHYCDKRTLSVDERLKLFQTVCAAVQHAHQNLVVHRDLKPSNILVTDAGEVKLLDFGIAKLLDEEQAGLSRPMTRTGMRVMTPEYASPEQVQGTPVTTASDVYAMGVVLYELLTGHRPYDLSEKSPLEVEQAVLEQAPERPSTAVTKVTERRHRDGTTEAVTPAAVSAARATSAERLQRRLRGDLDTILLKALQKEPERRYASAEAFLEDIKRHLAGRPVEARPDTLGYRLRKVVQRHRLGVATAAVFVVLLVGFAVAMAFQQAATARQRDHARLEADKLSEVRDFLVGLFEASDPGRSRGQTITAQDLLERGADRIEELAVQPEIQAELMATLGEIYRRLGLYNQARSFLEQALTVRRTLYGLQHPDIALSLQGLGNVYYSLGDYDAAQRVFEEALSMHRSGSGTAPLTLAHSTNKLALTLYTKGNYDEAEPLFREALSMFRTLHGEDHPDVARTLNNLASLAYAKEAYDEAERLARASLEIRRKVLGDPHPELAVSLGNLAFLTYRNGDPDEAERLYRETLQMRRTLFGEEHPDIARSLYDLAGFLGNMGRHEEAADLFQQALSMRKKLLGPEHLDVAKTLGELATIFHAQGRQTESESLYLEAIAVLVRTLPEDFPRTARLRIEFGSLLTEQGRYEEAEALLLKGYETLEARGQGTQQALEHLVSLYEASGKPDKAAEYRALLSEADS